MGGFHKQSLGSPVLGRERLDLLVSLRPGVASVASHAEYLDLDPTLLD